MTPPYPKEPEEAQEDESWEHPAPSSSPHGTAHVGKPTWVRRTRGLVLKTWEPKPLPRPKVDHGLAHFTALERSAEVFRYHFNRANTGSLQAAGCVNGSGSTSGSLSWWPSQPSWWDPW